MPLPPTGIQETCRSHPTICDSANFDGVLSEVEDRYIRSAAILSRYVEFRREDQETSLRLQIASWMGNAKSPATPKISATPI
jgi:hypothetical protein